MSDLSRDVEISQLERRKYETLERLNLAAKSPDRTAVQRHANDLEEVVRRIKLLQQG